MAPLSPHIPSCFPITESLLAANKGYKLDNENFIFRGSQKGERYCHDWKQAGFVQNLRSKGATDIHP